MKTYDLYLSGKFINTETSLLVKEKYTGKQYAKVSTASSKILEEAIKDSVCIEEEMQNLSSYEKYKILKNIGEALFAHKEYMAEIIAIEAAKPMKYALIEAERASQTFMIAAEESRRIDSEIFPLDWYSPSIKKEAIVKFFPIGTVAGITPFNFPLNLVAHKVAPAIAAGCPIILKPASATPLSALELAKIIQKSGLPSKAFSVLPMSHKISTPLIEDSRISKISFTGSPEVGWKMKNNCGKKRITLELGGNAGAIISKSADINEAVAKCVSGAFAYSGQVCIHTQRIFVDSSIFREFIDKFIVKTKQLKGGNPLNLDTDISVLIDEPNAVRIESWINEALNEGAELLIGGKRDGAFLEPTVLTNTNSEMKIWKDEIFGPVVLIESYNNFSEAINMVNNSEFGLQAGVFTNSIDEMNYAFRNIKAGGIMINESPTFRIDHMPYGGIKDSGFGREGIKYAIHEMSEIRLLVKPC